MAHNMSDDEDIDFRRQRFQHPDDPDDMDINSESDGEDEQVQQLPIPGKTQLALQQFKSGQLAGSSVAPSAKMYNTVS